MLTEYVDHAMRKATYEKLKDGTYFGRISVCPGVVATQRSLHDCQIELQEALEGWLVIKLRHGDRIPIVGGINLNRVQAPKSSTLVRG